MRVTLLIILSAGFNTILTVCEIREMPAEIIQYIRTQEWKNVLLVTDFTELVHIFSKNYIYSATLHTSNNFFKQRLNNYLSNQQIKRNIVVWCKTFCLRNISYALGMFRRELHWLLVYDDYNSFTNVSHYLSSAIKADSNIRILLPQQVWIVQNLQRYKSSSWNFHVERTNKHDVAPLDGVTLKAVITHFPPITTTYNRHGKIVVTGIRNDILLAIAQHLGFEIEYVFCTSPKDRVWSCLRQALLKNEVDVCGSFMPMSPNNNRNLTHSVTIYTANVQPIFPNIKYYTQHRQSSSIYAQPLSKTVVICVVVLYILCVLMSFFTRYGRFLPLHHFPVMSSWYQWLNKYIRECLIAVTPQGVDGTINSPARKIIEFTMTLFLFIIISTYTSNLFSHFAADRYKMPYETLHDMVRDGRFIFGARVDSPMDSLITRAQSRVFKEIREKLMYTTVPSMQDGLLRAASENFVFFCVTDYCINLDCSYEALKKTSLSFTIVVHFQKNSPYVELFSRSSVGILSKLAKPIYHPSRPQCEIHDVEYHAVRLSQCKSLFILLICGVLFAILILMFEVLLNK